jgi:GT2 family glycosyltransferase
VEINPVVSVIIPEYNGMAHIKCCLEALSSQSRQPDEIILVDDGSTDGCISVVKDFPVILLCQKHQGAAAARNRGAQSARGDILLFTDIDCEPDSDWVDQMVRPFSDPLIIGVKGSYRTKQTAVVARLIQLEFEERYDRLEGREQIDFVDSNAAGFRATAFRRMGGFDESLSNNEDVDLAYRLAQAGDKLVFNRKAIVFHSHPDTWVRYMRLKFGRGYWRTVIYHLHPAKAVKDSYTPQLLKLQIVSLYLGFLFLIIPIRFSVPFWVSLAFFSLTLLSAAPFIKRVFRNDPRLILHALVAILLRSMAFGAGIIAGLFGGFVFKPQIDRKRQD